MAQTSQPNREQPRDQVEWPKATLASRGHSSRAQGVDLAGTGNTSPVVLPSAQQEILWGMVSLRHRRDT